VWPRSTDLQRLTDAYHRHARQSGMAAAESVGGGVGKEDVAQPCAEVVDGGDEAAPTRIGLTEGIFEAWVDEHRCENADVVPGKSSCQLRTRLELMRFSMEVDHRKAWGCKSSRFPWEWNAFTHPQTNEPRARTKQK
jgi:hypothetical protein